MDILIADLNGAEIFGAFYEKDLEKTNQTNKQV